jgi:hypothetical protein
MGMVSEKMMDLVGCQIVRGKSGCVILCVFHHRQPAAVKSFSAPGPEPDHGHGPFLHRRTKNDHLPPGAAMIFAIPHRICYCCLSALAVQPPARGGNGFAQYNEQLTAEGPAPAETTDCIYKYFVVISECSVVLQAFYASSNS